MLKSILLAGFKRVDILSDVAGEVSDRKFYIIVGCVQRSIRYIIIKCMLENT